MPSCSRAGAIRSARSARSPLCSPRRRGCSRRVRSSHPRQEVVLVCQTRGPGPGDPRIDPRCRPRLVPGTLREVAGADDPGGRHPMRGRRRSPSAEANACPTCWVRRRRAWRQRPEDSATADKVSRESRYMSKQKQKQRIVELEQRVDALAAALWEVTRLTLVSTSDRVPPPDSGCARRTGRHRPQAPGRRTRRAREASGPDGNLGQPSAGSPQGLCAGGQVLAS